MDEMCATTQTRMKTLDSDVQVSKHTQHCAEAILIAKLAGLLIAKLTG